jgi:hypothetical protein
LLLRLNLLSNVRHVSYLFLRNSTRHLMLTLNCFLFIAGTEQSSDLKKYSRKTQNKINIWWLQEKTSRNHARSTSKGKRQRCIYFIRPSAYSFALRLYFQSSSLIFGDLNSAQLRLWTKNNVKVSEEWLVELHRKK